MENTIAANFEKINEVIARTASGCNRRKDAIQLVVVTKGQSVEKIEQVISAGAVVLGENYPEETHQKILEGNFAGSDIHWHMIGHLQSRKAKFIVEHFTAIHSIDSIEIAQVLDDKLIDAGKTIDALIEVNVSGEAAKHGFKAWDEAGWPGMIDELAMMIGRMKAIRFVGLMTMPPFAMKAEDSRIYFVKCRKLREELQKKLGIEEFTELSMGTSLDYEIAIQEGATYIRVGEAIMGPRNYL